MSKNPYEIRFDLLTMAWETMTKAMENNAFIYKDIEKYVPKMFTPEEVISQAEKLQSFINKKD